MESKTYLMAALAKRFGLIPPDRRIVRIVRPKDGSGSFVITKERNNGKKRDCEK